MAGPVVLRPIVADTREAVERLLRDEWGSRHVATINSPVEGRGVGSALVEEVARVAGGPGAGACTW